ncbi:ABC transporter substrate-binding protein [Candidatus Dependentiae bacterium]
MKVNKKNIVFIVLISLCTFIGLKPEVKKIKTTGIFPTLDTINEFAKNNPEYPDIDNNNWLDPDYTSEYKKNLPTGWEETLQWMGIKKPLWTAKKFKTLLKNVVNFRQKKYKTGRFVKRIEPTPGVKLVVFGNLFGAFHSLARILTYLKKIGVIDNKLNILDKNTIFVFEGNVIDLSPYILETLTIVLRLMETNPNNVIYLRGSHEEKETWLDFGLKTELEIKARILSEEKIPLKNLLLEFFRTLPLATYLTEKENSKIYAVRLSYPGMDYKELKEKEKDLEIKAIARSPQAEPIPKKGFEQKGKNPTEFILFSSPTKTFRTMNGFFYDSFAIIEIKDKFQDWTITHYGQDSSEKQRLGIHPLKTYSLSTGEIVSEDVEKLTKKVATLETTVEKYEDTLKKITLRSFDKAQDRQDEKRPAALIVGSTLGISGIFSPIGTSIQKGLYAAVDEINKKGGINGEEINLTILDNNGKTSKIRGSITELIEQNKVNFIISPLVISEENILADFDDENVLFMFPTPPTENNLDHVINFGPSYEQIAKFSITYARQKEKCKKFAFFYQEELVGGAISEIVAELPKDRYIKVPYSVKTISFENQAKKIRTFRPDALFLWSTPSAAKNIIKQIKPMNLTDTIIMGHDIGTLEFKKFLKKNNLSDQYIGIENIPNPYRSKLPIMQEYRNAMENKDLDIFSAQSYIATKAFEYIIKRAKNNLEINNILKIIKNIKGYNLGGIDLTFDSKNRSLSKHIWTDSSKYVWEKYVTKKTTYPQALSVRDDEIVMGTTMDLEGAVRGVSTRTLKAIKAAFFLHNKNKKTGGKEVKIVAENDNYKPKTARKNIEKLLNEDKIDIILNPVGGPTTEAYIKLIEDGKILVLFPSTGSPELRDPDLRYMINFRPSYNDIYAAAIKYLKDNENVKKIAFVYQDDAASGNAIQNAIEKNNLKEDDYIKIAYKRDQRTFEQDTKKIQEFEPDAIAFWCQTLIMQKIIKEIGAPNLRNKILLTTEMGSSAVLDYMTKIGLDQNFINTENIPDPATSDLTIMKEYREYLKTPDPFLAETYISTNYLLEILDDMFKAKEVISKEGIIERMEDTKNYDFKGFTLDFDPETRQLSNNIWIYKAGKEKAKVPTRV